MQTRLKAQLATFMFLQYFIWGSWYASMATYLLNALKFDGPQVGAAYGAFAIGSMISPFFVGLIADRFFASEKLLGWLGIVGGIILCLLPRCNVFGTFYPTLILYCALFTPTLGLGNSLALHHLKDAKQDFPRVKILSAVGWILGGLTLSLLNGEQTSIQFYLAGIASFAFGVFSFTLPHTPPKKVGQNVPISEILGLDALSLLRKPSFAIFVGCMFLICIPLYFYFVNMSIYLTELKWENMAAWMTLAQVSDVIFLFLLPLMLKRFGFKKTIFLGILSWALRYVLLSQSVGMEAGMQMALVLAAILLHGICYDFLFIAGQLYVDQEANERNRGACQGLIAFILWGIGSFVGTWLAGQVQGRYEIPVNALGLSHDWQTIWMIPAIGAAVVLGVFMLFFREPKKVVLD